MAWPLYLAGAGATAAAVYAAYRKSQGLPIFPRSADLRSAFAPSQYTPPLLTPVVTGIAPGWVLLARTVQPNGSLADLTVQVTQVLGGGMYAVNGRPDLDGNDPAWGLVYPSQVGDADIISKSDAQGNTISGIHSNRMFGAGNRFGMNPQPLPPKIRSLDPMARYHARQASLNRALR